MHCTTPGRWLVPLLLLACAAPARAESLAEALLKEGPALIKKLQEQKHKNVGVLKFQVKEGIKPASFNVGTLNLTLAQRLEIALILANSPKEELQLGVIRNASGVAAGLKGADHLTKDGRKVLFGQQYALAWGNQKVTPSVFLIHAPGSAVRFFSMQALVGQADRGQPNRTVAAGACISGLATLSDDLKQLTVAIDAYTANGDAGLPLAKFVVNNDIAGVVETGQSFLLRGALDGGKTEPTSTEAVTAAAQVKSKTATFPLTDEKCPIALEVRYDDKPAKIEIQNGLARIPDPAEGQKVTFVVRRRGESQQRYALVLKVNGESTLNRETMDDFHCAKWVLEPGVQELTIRGFQRIDAKKLEAFRVLSPAESQTSAARYGTNVGLITLAVFGERRGPEPAPVLDRDSENVQAITRAVLPGQTPRNALALRAQLRDGAQRNLSKRGVIDTGSAKDSELRAVSFTLEAVPLVQAAIRYYAKP